MVSTYSSGAAKAEPGTILYQEYNGAGLQERYSIEVVRSAKPRDEEGRVHWLVTVDAANFQHHFYMWLRPTSEPMGAAHRWFAESFEQEVCGLKGWTVAQVENARAVLAHAQRNVAKLGERGAIKYDWALVAIGTGIVLAARLAVGVWG